MRWAGYRQVNLSSVTIPGEIRKRMKEPRVLALAESIRELGDEPIHAPTLEGKELIAGRDRMAALMVLKKKRAWFRIATDVSAEDRVNLEVDENLHRRVDNRDELIARRVKRVAEEIRAREAEIVDKLPRNPGRPVTPEGRARAQVAAELQVTPSAVRKAEERAEAKAAPRKEPEPAADPLEKVGFDARGVALSMALRGEILGAVGTCEELGRLLSQCQRVLALVQTTALGQDLHQRLYRELHRIAELARSRRPVSVCTYCHAEPGKVEACTGCGTFGVLTEGQLVNAPKNGVPKPGKPPVQARKLRIEMDDGTVVEP